MSGYKELWDQFKGWLEKGSELNDSIHEVRGTLQILRVMYTMEIKMLEKKRRDAA